MPETSEKIRKRYRKNTEKNTTNTQNKTQKKTQKKSSNLKISSKSKISSIVLHLSNLLEKKDFFKPQEKRHSMILNINNLIYRLQPNDKELRILASIISTLSKK